MPIPPLSATEAEVIVPACPYSSSNSNSPPSPSGKLFKNLTSSFPLHPRLPLDHPSATMIAMTTVMIVRRHLTQMMMTTRGHHHGGHHPVFPLPLHLTPMTITTHPHPGLPAHPRPRLRRAGGVTARRHTPHITRTVAIVIIITVLQSHSPEGEVTTTIP